MTKGRKAIPGKSYTYKGVKIVFQSDNLWHFELNGGQNVQPRLQMCKNVIDTTIKSNTPTAQEVKEVA